MVYSKMALIYSDVMYLLLALKLLQLQEKFSYVIYVSRRYSSLIYKQNESFRNTQ